MRNYIQKILQAFILFSLLIFLDCRKSGETIPPYPRLEFFSPTTGYAPLSVHLKLSATQQSNPISKYVLHINGVSVTRSNPIDTTIIFVAGSYAVYGQVFDTDNLTRVTKVTSISANYKSVIASMSVSPTSGDAPLPVHLNLTGIPGSDPISKYVLHFDDDSIVRSNPIDTTINFSGGTHSVFGRVYDVKDLSSKTSITPIIVSPITVSSVEVFPKGQEIVAGDSIQLTAIIKNKNGSILTNRIITWTTSDSSVGSISSTGLVKGIYPGPIITITATCEGISGVSYLLVHWPPRGLKDMLWFLPYYISHSIDYNLSMLPNNPHIATQIETKNNILKSPSIIEDIHNEQLYYADTVIIKNNRQIPIGTIFLQENMRTDAFESVYLTKLALPILEDFMQTPYPFNGFEIWYGFRCGNTNGGDVIDMEDKGTYETSTGPDRMPYNAILFHEISHSYISHEGLTQFLHIYLYNMIYTNSVNIESWIYLQGYTPFLDSNTWVHALLDIYQLIGPSNMSKAFKILYTLHPPYGSPLSDECLQVFVDQAPSEVKEQVAIKAKSIDFYSKNDNFESTR